MRQTNRIAHSTGVEQPCFERGYRKISLDLLDVVRFSSAGDSGERDKEEPRAYSGGWRPLLTNLNSFGHATCLGFISHYVKQYPVFNPDPNQQTAQGYALSVPELLSAVLRWRHCQIC
jgi:hypothetical protein